MTKKSLLLVVLLTVYSFINAQEIMVGLKGGVNYNTIGDLLSKGGSIETGKPNEIFSSDKEMGTQYGAFIDISFGRFFLRPEIVFSSIKSSYALPLKVSNFTETRMDIPVLLGLHIYGPLSIVAGPVFSNVTKFELEGLDSYSPVVLYDKSVLNLQVGILLEVGRFGLDLRYEYGLKTVEKQENLDFNKATYGTNLANLLEYNSSQIIISVHVNIARFNSQDRKRMSRSDWRDHRHL